MQVWVEHSPLSPWSWQFRKEEYTRAQVITTQQNVNWDIREAQRSKTVQWQGQAWSMGGSEEARWERGCMKCTLKDGEDHNLGRGGSIFWTEGMAWGKAWGGGTSRICFESNKWPFCLEWQSWCYRTKLGSACLRTVKPIHWPGLLWRKVLRLLQGTKKGVQVASAQKPPTPQRLSGKCF